MFENNNWQKNFIIFTNKIDATASIFVHLGYGNISATGDFKNISLQEQEQVTDRRTRRSGFKCEQSPLLQRDSEEYKSYCLKLRPDPVFFSSLPTALPQATMKLPFKQKLLYANVTIKNSIIYDSLF